MRPKLSVFSKLAALLAGWAEFLVTEKVVCCNKLRQTVSINFVGPCGLSDDLKKFAVIFWAILVHYRLKDWSTFNFVFTLRTKTTKINFLTFESQMKHWITLSNSSPQFLKKSEKDLKVYKKIEINALSM